MESESFVQGTFCLNRASFDSTRGMQHVDQELAPFALRQALIAGMLDLMDALDEAAVPASESRKNTESFLIMKIFALIATIIFALAPASLSAQTVSLNDSSIIQKNTNRMGLNIGSINYWDNGQILKNLIGSTNPGFEPLLQQQIWALSNNGTTTTFTVPDQWDGVPANYWAGGTFSVVASQSGGAELGCTGTIASNTGPNYPITSTTPWVDPTVTVSSACAAPFAAGDIVILKKTTFPTPESWWETGGLGGFSGSVSGGGKLVSNTTDLCPTCGSQSLTMDASASGSSASAAYYFDSANSFDLFVLVNGTYQISFWAKSTSGSPKLTVNALRLSSGGFNCGTYTQALTSTWTQYTLSCSASESSSSTAPGTAKVSFSVSGGAIYLDNVAFQKATSNNDTVLRDEVVQALQNFYGPANNGPSGLFRYWVNQNAESLDNWTKPDYARSPSSSGTGYFVGPGGAGSMQLSLHDYLEICKLMNAEPYLEVPVTLSTTDATNLIEFLGGGSTSTYGARRASLGQTDPWTSVFSKIHLSFCNECWNGYSFVGQSLPSRSGTPNPEYYYDYSIRARDIFAAMRKSSSYVSSSFDLVMNAQTAVNWSMDTAIARAHPDSIEIEDYTYSSVSDYSTDAALWGPALVEPYMKVTYASDPKNFYQSVHDYQSQTTCGASGTATCNVNIYEWGQGTINGSIDQAHLDAINAGAGQGVVMALQPLLNLQYYGIRPQSFFSLTEYQNGSANGLTSKLWGNVVDMGGATSNVRPTFLGVSLVNQSIIGPMYSCPISNNLTYNFAGTTQNGFPSVGMPAMQNVPYLYSFCFQNGTKRSIVLVNTDINSSHKISFSGTNAPSGTVTQRQFAPSSLNDLNEAASGSNSNTAQALTAIETSTLSSPASITLPPNSVTALDYSTSGSLPTAAAPSFSPAGGSYTSNQTVTLSTTTTGATIYYTTDGSTPTTASNVYTSPITVSSNQTIEAIAVASGYTESSVAAATYTITYPTTATPTFSVAGGTYASTQTVAISDATSGANIYYTTNGSTPTTSSPVYSAPLSISSTTTLKAIALKSGYMASSLATATYTINTVLPTPAFSVAGGTYTSSQTVSISDSVAGTTIYYTTNGTTPTTSSSVYSGAITISSTATLKALAVKSGYTNSAVASATYTINPVLPTPAFSVAAGTYTAAQTVSISDATSGTTIYYTTNGTTPTTSSSVYSGAISISSTTTLQAIAVKSGYTNSTVAAATYTISTTTTSTNLPNYANGFSATNLNLVYRAGLSSNVLNLTTGSGQIGAAWFTKKVPVSSFTTDFTFQLTNATADGFTFTIQNSSSNVWALGYGTAGLGYQSLNNSFALKFDIYNNAGEGTDSIGVYTGGAAPTTPSTDLSTSGVVLKSGDPIKAHLVYSGTTLTVTLTDLKTSATVTKSFTVNIPTAVGGTTAYVGFTGSAGAFSATQQILNWTFSN